MKNPIVYIGTYTQVLPHVHGSAEGVYAYQLDGGTGALSYVSVGVGVVNPSFVTVDAQRRFLYAVQEIGEYAGQSGGAVSAFAIDAETQAFTLINSQPTHGAHPCNVSIDASGQWLLVANYSGGNVTVLPIGADGELGAPTAVVAHVGVPTHHDAPHPHSIGSLPGDWVLATDCGLDRIAIYRLDGSNGTLAANNPPWVMLAPGAGPRHVGLHQNERWLYCINERNSTMTAFAYDAGAGTLNELQTLSTLPADYAGSNSCADVHIHPSGQFVYGSNRGHDSIAIFGIDPATGLLELRGHHATGGRTPRNFAIDPSGSFLLVANQDSNTVMTLRIDLATGALHETGQIAAIPTPVCLCFA
jgi:6-phosphogluconolactonase